MPTQQYNLGRDVRVVIITPNGRLDIGLVTGFQSRQMTAPIRVDALTGDMYPEELPKGYEGSFALERASSVLERYIISRSASFRNGGILGTSTMYQYIDEIDRSTSTYQFVRVAFKLTDAGNWRGDATVRQTLSFFAGDMVQIA